MANEAIGPQVKVSLPRLVIECIDTERGRVPRSEWLRALICERYTLPSGQDGWQETPQELGETA